MTGKASVRWGLCPCGANGDNETWVVRDHTGRYIGCGMSWRRAMRIAVFSTSADASYDDILEPVTP